MYRPFKALALCTLGLEQYHLHLAKFFLGFTSRQSSDRNSWGISSDHFFAALLTKFQVEATLDNAEQILPFGVFMRLNAPI
jgi:hypothetical protein